MEQKNCWEKLSLIVSSIFLTALIIAIISLVWCELEEIYFGAFNQNPVDTIITMIYSIFVYLWAKRWLGGRE